MKDFIKKYHNKKVIGNIGIVLASLVLAFGINTFLIDGTNIGDSIKASVLDSNTSKNKADLYLEANENEILIKNSKNILNAETISLSLIYNPENLTINSVDSNYGESLTLGEKNTGIDTIIIKTNNQNIGENSELLKIKTIKKENKSEQLNLINVNFKDSSGEKYDLSTSGITF